MQGVEAISVHIVGRLARAANAGEHRYLVGRDLQIGEGTLDAVEDGEVTTAGAPGVVLGRLVVFDR